MEFYPLFFTGIGFMISATIIDNISKGSLKAFKVFFDQYYMRVRNFANGIVKNNDCQK